MQSPKTLSVNHVTTRQRTVRIKKKKSNYDDEQTTLIQSQFAERWAPNYYIERREGQVLGRGMLLKYDIFPSSKIVKTDVSISGGPNYRKINDQLPLCAVGQPSIHGIRTILNLLVGSRSNQNIQSNELDDFDQSIMAQKSSNTQIGSMCIQSLTNFIS